MTEKSPSYQPIGSPMPQLSKQQWIAIAKIVIVALLQIAALFGFDLLPDLGGILRRIGREQSGDRAA